MGSARLLPTRRSADGRFRGALPRESLPRRRQRCRRGNQRAASPWPPRAGPPEPRAVLPQRKPRRGVCPNSVQTRIQCESPGRSSLLSCGSCRSAHAISRRTCSNMLSAGSGRARSAPARNGGRRPSHPTAAGHSAAVADALEDEGWPGCQGSRASATGYDRALLALSRVLNPTTRATRRHTASMRTFDESLAWPLRTLRSA